MSSYPPPLRLTAEQWGMPGPLGHPMPLPASSVFLHHTVTRVTADPLEDALAVSAVGVRRFGRMSYSVLIHPARVIFWAQTAHIGAHTAGRNSSSIGIALVGRYDKSTPSDELVYDACLALDDLRRYGVLVDRPKVNAHLSVAQTACPGSRAITKVLPVMRAVARDPSWHG